MSDVQPSSVSSANGDRCASYGVDFGLLLAGSGVDVLLLGADRRILEFTAGFAKHLPGCDLQIGADSCSLLASLNLPSICDDLRSVQDRGIVVAREVTLDDHTYLIRVLPYQHGGDPPAGAPTIVISMINVSEVASATAQFEPLHRESKSVEEAPARSNAESDRDDRRTGPRVPKKNRDIIERKRYELELESIRDAAESANRAKSAFLAQMSHEIRTPMTAIVGCAEQLQQSVKLPANRQLSRVMVEQGQSLMSLLDDILDLSRIEADKIGVEPRPTDVPRVLRDLHRLMVPRANETGLVFDLELRGEFPRSVIVDPVRLRQIIVNLLSNAFKFTRDGKVILAAACFQRKANDWELQISVEDSGIGIPSGQLKRIFEAFARLENAGAKANGTGLGLTIANRLVELLGGEMDVTSVEGVGTTFYVRIPVLPPSQTDYWTPKWGPSNEPGTPRRSGQQEQADQLPMHVLVVEDTDAIRFLLGRILSGFVNQLTMAVNGQEAVQRVIAGAESEGIDLILMDMQMPVMNGLDATRKIRAAGFDVPIVALTAGAMDADRQQCLDAGCTEFMTKPIDRKLLVDVIQRYSQI